MSSEARTDEKASGKTRDAIMTATALVGGLVGLFTAVTNLVKEVRLLYESGGQPSKSYGLLGYGLLAFLALYVLVWLARRRFAPPSTFRRPSALDIGRKYLRGRDTDLENLLNRLKDFPLVWLVGESGAGKSSLLVLGLVPRLENEKSFFPVYLEHWGADWDRGPREGLCRALNESLDEATRQKLGLVGPVDVNQVVPVLGRMMKKLGQTPVLIFDQFDDYQTRHREDFLRGEERKIVPGSTLRAENTFWNDIAELFKGDKARCLFVTRTDMQWGLECVKFGEPEIYVLGPLGRTYAAELLDEITSGDVVVSRERGWDGLKRRLLDDLGKDGWVLPIRMKFAFRGLRELRALSVGHYEREGRLAGLEALDVKGQLAQAARLASWKEDDVRQLLLEMVDRESQSKTVPRTNAQLLASMPESGRDEDRLVQALRTLQDADILRQRIDRDQPGGAVWLLYHDYLCRGILELDRRTRRWQILLEEAMRAFERTRGIVGKWRSLLRPALQIRFVHARLRRQLRYGNAGRFAAVSAVRLVVNVWVIGFVLGLVGWSYLDAQREAQDLFYPFTLTEGTSHDEAEALWRLSGTRESVRRAFYRIVFSKKSNKDRFLNKSDQILQATLGLSQEYRRKLLMEFIEDNCYKKLGYEDSSVCLRLVNVLPPPHKSKDVSDLVLDWIFEVIAQTQDIGQLSVQASELRALGYQLPPEAADDAFNRIVEVIAQTQDVRVLSDLVRGLEALGDQLPPEAADNAFNRIVELIAQTQDRGQLDALAHGLEILGKRLRDGTAESSLRVLLGYSRPLAHV